MTPTAELLIPEVIELVRAGAYPDLRDALHHVPAADVADILSELEPADAAVCFRVLQHDDAGVVFSYLEQEKQERLVAALGTADAARVFETMPVDDRARVLDELPAAVAERIVASLSPESRKETQAILGYPPRTVGRLMTPDYVSVRPGWTVAQALEHIRRRGRDAETINVVYVSDESGKLIDDIRLRQLIFAEPTEAVSGLMNGTFYALRADQAQHEAVTLLKRYDRTALPVVDSRGNLIGIVTHDDLADVAEQEATEDIQKVGGVSALEESFADAPILTLVKKRAPWLALLFCSELLTSNTLRYFDDEIAKLVVLSAFVPAIISSGGNSGSQASTLVIRALALGEVHLRDWWKVFRREVLVCGALGLIIGGIGFFRVWLWGVLGWWTETRTGPDGSVITDSSVQEHYLQLATTISLSLFGVVIWGSLMGAMLPFLLKRCKLDPAGSSTPFVATLVDVTGIVIYFTVAITVLRGTLL